MKVSKVTHLDTHYNRHDIVTETENFYVKFSESDDIWGLVHNSPAVYMGINPENGKFFVATKSLFNKTPKLNYTDADIKANHGGGLLNILPLVLKYGRKLGIKSGIYQGDLMFTPDMLRKTKIDGESHLLFQPNTIAYAVPENSDMGKQIKAAKIGIVFHTEYTGKTVQSLSANFNIKLNGKIKKTKDVFWSDAYFKDVSGTATFTASESAALRSEMQSIRKIGGSLKGIMNSIASNSEVEAAISQYINSVVRSSSDTITISTSGLLNYAQNIMKTSAVKRESNVKFIHANKQEIEHLFKLHQKLASVKLQLVAKLAKVKSMKHFLTKGNDLVVTGPEGFVSIDRAGNALKLVDRMSFSKANFCR